MSPDPDGRSRVRRRLSSQALESSGLFILSLGVSAIYWAVFLAHYVPVSDAEHYWQIASNLAAGKGFSHVYPGTVLHETAFRLPLWPGVLAAALVLFGVRLSVAMALNAVIGALVVVQVAALARQVGGRRAGLVAGLAAAVYPPLIANDVVPLSEPLGLLLLLVVVRLVGARRWMWTGVATGLFLLVKDGALVVLVGLVPLVVVAAGWRHAARLAIVVSVVVAPWIVRNEIQLHHTVLTTSVGYNLAAAYSRYSQRSGGFFVDPVRDRSFSRLWPRRSDEARWDASLEQLGLEGLASRPTRVVAVARYNVASVIGYHRRTEDVAERLDGRVLGVVNVSRSAYYGVSLLGLAGLVRWRRDRTVRALGIVVALLVALSVITVYAPRLRAPFDVACVVGLGLLFADRERSLHGDEENGLALPSAIHLRARKPLAT